MGRRRSTSRSKRPTLSDKIWQEVQEQTAEVANNTLEALNEGFDYFASEMMYAVVPQFVDADESTVATTTTLEQSVRGRREERIRERIRARRSKSSKPITKTKKQKKPRRSRSEERLVQKKRDHRIKSLVEKFKVEKSILKNRFEEQNKTPDSRESPDAALESAPEAIQEVRDTSAGGLEDEMKSVLNEPAMTAENIFRPRSELDASDASLRFRYIAGAMQDGATMDATSKKIRFNDNPVSSTRIENDEFRQTQSLFNADSEERESPVEERDAAAGAVAQNASTKPSVFAEVNETIEKVSNEIAKNTAETPVETDNELLIITEICNVQKSLLKLEQERVLIGKEKAGLEPPSLWPNRKSDLDRVQEIKSHLLRLQELSTRHQLLKARKRARDREAAATQAPVVEGTTKDASPVEETKKQASPVEETTKEATDVVAPQSVLGRLFCPAPDLGIESTETTAKKPLEPPAMNASSKASDTDESQPAVNVRIAMPRVGKHMSQVIDLSAYEETGVVVSRPMALA